jgi:MoxR-like ATPase
MQEHEVTAGGSTFRLEEPFFVLATQNPIEQEGTYPLPEAQLDRFIFNMWIDYPSVEEEKEIVRSTTGTHVAEVKEVLDGPQIVELQQLIRKVPVADHVIDYAVGLVRRTRPGGDGAPATVSEMVSWGAGPRASQYLILGAKARAILEGRYAAAIEDVQSVATPVLRHRIVTTFNAEAEGITTVDLIERLLAEENG